MTVQPRPYLTAANTQAVADILGEIATERARQDDQWGEQNHPDVDPIILARMSDPGDNYSTPGSVAHRLAQEYEIPTASRAKWLCQTAASRREVTWAHVAVEELAEAVDAATVSPAHVRAEVIQLAAVCAAWVEAIDRRIAAAQATKMCVLCLNDFPAVDPDGLCPPCAAAAEHIEATTDPIPDLPRPGDGPMEPGGIHGDGMH